MGDEQQAGRGARPGRRVLLALAVLIPTIPVAIGILIGQGQPGAGASAAGAFAAVPSHQTTTAEAADSASTPANAAGSTRLPVPAGPGAIVAVLTHPTTLRAAPGGRSIAHLSTKTEFGSPETVLVVRHVPGWLGVVATKAGNGHVGWIAQRAASLARTAWQIKVSLSARRLTVLNASKVVVRYTVAIGQPTSPTPTGRFAVTDRLLTGDPGGPYGCCILALSAHAPHAIQAWNGGNRIAIHSTPEVGSIGQAASHGCLRLTLAEGRWLVDHIPLGTPTLISS